MCREEKIVSTLQQGCKIADKFYFFKKNAEAATGGAEAFTGGVLYEKVFLKISQTSQENYCVGVFSYEVASSCKPSACMFFKKRLQHKCFSVKSAKLLRTPILRNICKQLLMEVFYKKSRSSSLCPLFFIKFLFFDQMIGLLKL